MAFKKKETLEKKKKAKISLFPSFFELNSLNNYGVYSEGFKEKLLSLDTFECYLTTNMHVYHHSHIVAINLLCGVTGLLADACAIVVGTKAQ